MAVVGDTRHQQGRLRRADRPGKAELHAADAAAEVPAQGTTEYETIKGQAMTLLVQQAEREAKATSMGSRSRQADRQAPRPDQEAVLPEQRGAVPGAAQEAAPDRRAGAQGHPRPADLGGGLQEGHERRQGRRRRGARLLHRAPAALLEGRRRATCATSSSRTKASADSIYAQLKAGDNKTWCTLAKKFSQDPSSKDNCGKLTVSKGQTVAEFDKVAFSEKTNAIHAPIHNAQYGWFVIEPSRPCTRARRRPRSRSRPRSSSS